MTDKTRLKSRPATAADVYAFFGKASPHTVRARVLDIDGEIAAIAGYYISGGVAVVFSDIKLAVPKMTIWREARAMMDGLKLPAVCLADCGSGLFLERLGWSEVGTTKDGDIYKWQH